MFQDYNEVSKKIKISVKTFLNSRNPDQFLYSTKEHSILDQKKAKLEIFLRWLKMWLEYMLSHISYKLRLYILKTNEG